MENIQNFDEYTMFESKIDGLSNKDMTYEEKELMLSFSSKVTGIDGVVIWIGKNPHNNQQRIKINTTPKSINCFSITLPELDVIGHVDKNIFTDKVIKRIKQFIEINYEIIVKIMNDEEAISILMNKFKKV